MLPYIAILLVVSVCWSGAEHSSGTRQLTPVVDNCSQVIAVDASSILEGSNPLAAVGVKGISFSVSYSVSDAVKTLEATELVSQACHVQVAKIINKAGAAVSANAAGAQASVRATNFNDPAQQQCAGDDCLHNPILFGC